MKGRLFAIALVFWATLASLFGTSLSAQAAGAITCTLNSATTMACAGGNLNGTLDLTQAGNLYHVVATCGPERFPTGGYSYVVTIGAANKTAGGYAGTIATTLTGVCPGITKVNGAVTIADPNGVGPGGGSPPPGGTGQQQQNEPTDCNAGPGFTWLICGMIDIVAEVVDWIRNEIIIPMLTVPPLAQTWANGSVYSIWESFRNVSSIFFILVFFLVIFGTAIGFDNYTIKKILPRLIAGAILVSFSWYICVFCIDAGNVVGQGLLSLAYSLIPPAKITFNTSLDALFVGGLLAAAAAGFVIASLGLLVTILIALVVAFFTLVFRQVMITILIVISPFALLAWILPNTERYFKLWINSFIRLILMYPLVMLLFIAGQLFAYVAGAGGYGGGGDKFLSPFLALMGLYAPLLMVPMTFKWGGAAMALGTNAINKAGSAANAKWGKDSAGAKERHERFQQKQASRLKDESYGNAFTRGLRRRQSGTGGFILGRERQAKKDEHGHALTDAEGNVVYKKQLPFTQTSAQRLKQHEMGEHYDNLEGHLKGIEEYERKSPDKKPQERIDVAAAAQYDKMFAAGQAAALYSTKVNGKSARDLYLGGADSDEEGKAVQRNIDDARARGDNQALMTHLSHAKAGGLNNLEFLARQAHDEGDQVKLAAVMSRLSMSGGAQDRLQDIATGSTLLTKDAHGNVRAVGGNGMNAVGTGFKDGDGFYREGWKDTNGVVHETQEKAGPGATRVAAYTYAGAVKADGTHNADAGALHGLIRAEADFDAAKSRGASQTELAALGKRITDAREGARAYQQANHLGAALGGDFSHNVDAKWQDSWNRGTVNAKHGDFNKPQGPASTDYSAADLAGMHWSEVKRRINYAQQTGNTGALADLSEGAQGVGDSKLLTGRSSSDAKRILGSIDGVVAVNGTSLITSPDQRKAVANIDASIHPERYAPSASIVSGPVAQKINAAVDNDPARAAALHAVIQQEGGPASPTLQAIQQHIVAGDTNETIANTINTRVTAAAAPAPANPMSKDMYQAILKQTSNNWDETHRMVEEYHKPEAEGYRNQVNQAFINQESIPSPGGGPTPTGPTPPPDTPNEE